MTASKIAIAFPTGPCFGVGRALDVTKEVLKRKRPVYMLHPLIHNPRVVRELQQQGVVISPPEDIPEGGTVILSAHGTPLEIKNILGKKRANIIDAVCPLVEHLHRKAKELIDEGRFLIIVADPHHQETLALVSHLPNGKYVFYKDLDKAPRGIPIGVVFQTTYEYAKVPDVLKDIYTISDDIRIVNTICPATRGRQGVIDRVGSKYDFIVVVGGKNSANTKRLYEKAKSYTAAIWIEKADDIDDESIKDYRNILIVGGASTPVEHLIEVYLHFKKVIQ
ncbi:4-hydroxy-3-methylbut-2-enyl diphosphate reductase [bacterium 3DAC]|jgi:4-hydroxy-3-methylbut-2-enyl diphosphate reductase|nr:4-hydroxy-3-methylbut-2-enyl diphosphate reductase [Dictyoglomota bacterium]UZN23151.1 4-hydroxy-3-methylbut-2-enyl diphosphate reductase [bacterium 3DAC]